MNNNNHVLSKNFMAHEELNNPHLKNTGTIGITNVVAAIRDEYGIHVQQESVATEFRKLVRRSGIDKLAIDRETRALIKEVNMKNTTLRFNQKSVLALTLVLAASTAMGLTV